MDADGANANADVGADAMLMRVLMLLMAIWKLWIRMGMRMGTLLMRVLMRMSPLMYCGVVEKYVSGVLGRKRYKKKIERGRERDRRDFRGHLVSF